MQPEIIDDKLLVYFDDEEHIVRRLGAAVVSCWADLPSHVQEQLMSRSGEVLDADEDSEFGSHLRTFLADHLRRHTVM